MEKATNQPGNILASISKYTVLPEFMDQFKTQAAAYVSGAVEANGNLMAEAFTDRDHDDLIWIAERWTSSEEQEQFMTSHALPAPSEVYLVEDLLPLSREEWRRQPDAADAPFVIMLLLQTLPGKENTFKSRYHAALPEFREEEGVVTYQLCQFINDATRFITYEKFRSDAAFQYHLKFPPIVPIIDFLRNSIQDPPFEKGLHFLTEFAPNQTKTHF